MMPPLSKRGSGILLHITSLPGEYSIGTLGKEAKKFIKFLKKAGQSYWQILPLNPTGFKDSPYQCFSVFAGNPLLIDLETLKKQNLLNEKDVSPLKTKSKNINYGQVIQKKYPILKKSYENFLKNKKNIQKLKNFCKRNKWLEEYSVFMALKNNFEGTPWFLWPQKIKMREKKEIKKYKKKLKNEQNFQKFLQYLFFSQWEEIKKFAQKNNIKIIGDMPLYIAHDSVEAWSSPQRFSFDKKKNLKFVAGYPPDYFSSTGQLWGNPIYNWTVLEKEKFQWWRNRIKFLLKMYDVVRIDHFLGLAMFWQIPYGAKTAENGIWKKAKGELLLKEIQKKIQTLPIIAEDLGDQKGMAKKLREKFNLPGMKILQFCFEDKKELEKIEKNSVLYTGTHDNDTTKGWFQKQTKEKKDFICEKLGCKKRKNVSWDMIQFAMNSVANTVIIPLQDILNQDSKARMNFPGTSEKNWIWRSQKKDFSKITAQKLKNLTLKTKRI